LGSIKAANNPFLFKANITICRPAGLRRPTRAPGS
jgi:hypothetical protein